ncbi:MAG: TFIIB-type zinc finger domain-containing protein [Oxalobacter sp.]|nr:TFIIB-type zinc finger domain-containing protein [Oxalobacter sp.]
MMKKLVCANCGASLFTDQQGIKVCQFCNSQHQPEKTGKPKKQSTISLQSDIDRLLQKCRDDPVRARRYAGLVLDIDPTNKEARQYL